MKGVGEMMKNLVLGLLGVGLSGCCAYCNINTNPPKECMVNGEKAIASFYVQNVSYRLFSFIPICSGVTWQKGGIDNSEDWEIDWFEDSATLDENMKCLDHACDVVGSHRIGALSHYINEDPFWSFFICNRRTIKTECLIFEPKKK